ncbi:uncharacterized protein LOC108217416 [Daucus carota subsp. sativus]|uniref:uncharacterized protein LOC108217416 n=1 Tax=Daucus carota subsp. sativus TaxID=79200 RepID=UPI003082ACFF
MADDKAPGPDGLNVRSLKFLWPLIAPKVMDFFEKFHSSAFIPSGLNSSFITLVPKCASPESIKDFRPISLINTTFKLLSKVLANRLAKHIKILTSDTQTGFVKGRQASEGILIVKEIVHALQKGRRKGLVFKLDFEKAFDTINWEFLFEVLARMNFDQKWIGWMRALLKSSRISVLVNGSPSKEFEPGRGLRQGDPLSPLLFNLAGEVLSAMLTKAAGKGIFSGIPLGDSSQNITHLQFADDTVVFVNNSLESVRGVKSVLQCFQMISGLKINFMKSEIFAHKDCMDTQLLASQILRCKVGTWPMTYLGIPIGISSRRQIFWKPLINKFSQKLASWKADFLNLAGKTTLVKAVLDSLPLHWLGMHLLPNMVCDRLERIRRDFLWGNYNTQGEIRRKIHLVKWSRVCAPKDQGGLGLVPIKIKNLALLGKWSFRWEVERKRSWNIWIRDKYGCSNHESLQESLEGSKASNSLQDMVKAANHPAYKGSLKKRCFKWIIGDGMQTLFWEDNWFEDCALMIKFRRLYGLSTLQGVSVSCFLRHWSEPCPEKPLWKRNLRSWEEEEQVKLNLVVSSIKLSKKIDKMVWQVTGKEFSVNNAVKEMTASHGKVNWEFIWKLKVPQKIKFFLWKMHLDILTTRDFFSKRDIFLPGDDKCFLCGKCEETSGHLFYNCDIAIAQWKMISRWWLVCEVWSQDFNSQKLWESAKLFQHKKAKCAWKIVIGATLWVIWTSRNAVVFKGEKVNIGFMMSAIKQHAKEWCLAAELITDSSLAWWDWNPMGTITRSETLQLQSLTQVKWDLIGFVDGSWKNKQGQSLAGIGGFIQKKNGDCIFTFAGPCGANGALEAEWLALTYLIQNFLTSKWASKSLIIYTDCSAVIHKFMDSYVDRSEEARWPFDGLAQVQNIQVRCIPRDLNSKADFLAKSGAQKNQISLFWAQV